MVKSKNKRCFVL